MTPKNFPRRFAAALSTQNTDDLMAMFQPDATLGSLTGLWAETPEDIRAAFDAELAGICKSARLVTGKGTLRDFTANATLLRQRYMISGAQSEPGAELPRFGAILIAVLENGPDGWQVQSMTFNALP